MFRYNIFYQIIRKFTVANRGAVGTSRGYTQYVIVDSKLIFEFNIECKINKGNKTNNTTDRIKRAVEHMDSEMFLL